LFVQQHLAAERSRSAAAAATVSCEIPETETAAAVCCSAGFGGKPDRFGNPAN